jgi:hypothetical protein
MIMRFKEFISLPKKIRIEVPKSESKRLEEATRATVGNYTARRDKPHFNGDEYHAHADIPGGYEVGWGISGDRRHSKKFPAEIPKNAKAAIAKVLGVDVALLETYSVHDEVIDEEVFLAELSGNT